MSIQVLFFGAAADIAGSRNTAIETSDETTASQIVARIISDHPALRRHKLLFSLNQEYVSGDVIVKDGDEVAIFTAVSGG
jgi:molybdopterin converting factor small subunit